MPAPPPDPFETFLGYHLRRLSVAVMSDLTAALAPIGLKPAEASILYVLKSHPGLTQSEIGKILGIQRANMAPLIAGLMQRGLLDRRSVDGRSQSLKLTPTGEKTRAAAWAANTAHEARMFAPLTAPARQKLLTQLRTLWHPHANT